MNIETEIPLLEAILSEWKETIGKEYQGYRNHVYRMLHFCFALNVCSEDDRQKLIIAGAFHDLGIWIKNTVDYIPPSLPPMREYLKYRDLEAWTQEVELMITEHHKIRAYRDQTYPLVEVFRKGDLVDFSLGLIRVGIPTTDIAAVKAAFPNADFHKNLSQRAAQWILKHPFNPMPMMKW